MVFRNSVTDVDAAAQAITNRPRGRLATYKSALHGLALELSDSAVTARASQTSPWSRTRRSPLPAPETGWGLNHMDQRSLPLDGSTCRCRGSDGTGVTAYIIDTGIDFTGNEFGGRATTGVNEITSGGTATVQRSRHPRGGNGGRHFLWCSEGRGPCGRTRAGLQRLGSSCRVIAASTGSQPTAVFPRWRT